MLSSLARMLNSISMWHPTDEKGTGPHAQFITTFPKAGIYKVWGQFQHHHEILTVPFVVKGDALMLKKPDTG